MNKVSFYRTEHYDVEKLCAIVERIISDHGGWDTLFAKGKKVVIKPNLVVKKKPEGCATTHPAILEAVIRCLLPHTKDITVAECPGGPNTEALLSVIYKDTGIFQVCERYQIPIQMKMTPVTLKNPSPISAGEVDVLEIFTQADVFINLAKMKTHSLTTVTGCAKNLYGTIPGMKKIEYHAAFPQVEAFSGLICDLNRLLPPTLSILDGVWGMEKDGPSGGIPKFAGGVLGGTNTFAVDLAMCRFMGVDPALSPILNQAEKNGLFDGRITVVGDDLEEAKPTPFLLPDSQKKNLLRDFPNLFGGKLARYLSPRPKITPSRCIGCGECARLCPQKTIVIQNKKAHIIKKNCIRCWCCQELCPKKAVKTQSHWFLKYL